MNPANGAFILLGALLLFVLVAAASNGLSIAGYVSTSTPSLNPSNPLIILAGIFLLATSFYVLRRWGRR